MALRRLSGHREDAGPSSGEVIVRLRRQVVRDARIG
jgi:hypothetical protein